jgi:putative transposase
MLKKRYWGSPPWAKGYLAVTVGNVSDEDIQEYIENQEVHHASGDFQISDF